MAIALDTAVQGGGSPWAHPCTGANRLLLIATDGVVTSGTYAGVALTLIQTLTLVGGSGGANTPLKLWAAFAPTAGANNIVLVGGGRGTSVSYTGAQQAGPLDAVITNVSSTSATALTTSLTTVADNAWLVVAEWGYSFGAAPTAGTGLTLRGNLSAYGSPALFDSNAPQTPAGSHSGQTQLGAGSAGESIYHIMASIAPSGGGGGGAAGGADVAWWLQIGNEGLG